MPILQLNPFATAAFDAAFDQSMQFNNPTKTPAAPKSTRTWHPTGLHVQKSDTKYTIFIDVPGVKQGDMEMQLTDKNRTLQLSGVRKFHTSGDEVEEAKFEKHFDMGHDVDVEKISANLSNGVLEITAPKKEAPKPTMIPIQTSGAKLWKACRYLSPFLHSVETAKMENIKKKIEIPLFVQFLLFRGCIPLFAKFAIVFFQCDRLI